MATTENRISRLVGKDGKSQIIVKLTISRDKRPCFKSGVYVNPKYFKVVKETSHGKVYDIVPPKVSELNTEEKRDTTTAKIKLDSFINRLMKICQVVENEKKDELTKEWIDNSLAVTVGVGTDKITYEFIIQRLKEKQESGEKKNVLHGFFDVLNEYLIKVKLSYGREKNYHVLIRDLHRFERYICESDKKRKGFKLDLNVMDKGTITEFENYLRDEHTLIEGYPDIYAEYPETSDKRKKVRVPQQRSDNTISTIMKRFRAFCSWCIKNNYTNKDPFKGYKNLSEIYGTPYYLTLEERDIIAEWDFSNNPQLEVQRDIFIFQCLIGCRVGDLLKMTEKNIIKEAIEYIPRKTKDERPFVARIPLTDKTRNLIAKYHGVDKKGRLFPFLTPIHYNEKIKEILTICRINRMITILDPLTREEIKAPINKVASSHLARRTFIANLYNKVKDPNLIGSMSGHAEGSKAFARYRAIDDDIKKEVLRMIE
jgi:integrase